MGIETVNSRQRLDRIFADIRREGSEGCSARWRDHFDRSTSAPNKIVLFGTGHFGQLTVERLRAAGVEPCCFSDNNKERWSTHLNGLDVLPPAEAAARYRDSATFAVTIFNGSSARAQLREMGCRNVVSAATLFWKFPREFMPDLGIDSPELLSKHENEIRACFELLADEASRNELCDQIQWRYWFDPEFLPRQEDPADLYFPQDLVNPHEDEVLVDCGAFDGDCIQSLLRLQRSFKHLYAIEPDGENRRRLHAFLSKQSSLLLNKVTVLPYAISDRDGTVHLSGTGDVSSKMTTSENKNLGQAAECRRLDSLEWISTPTYIKMDIEGAEPNALSGASRLLREAMPVLAICLYHRSEHLWEIPTLIHALQPGYSLYLRRYAEDCWEQVCYAIPRHRLGSHNVTGWQTGDSR